MAILPIVLMISMPLKKHLEEQGVPYSDWGNTAVKGWHQIFFYDPEGNVIEVHQAEGDQL